MLKSALNFIFPGTSTAGEKRELMGWLSLAALIIVLDQISKLWISSHFIYGESLRVMESFNLVLAHNTGAAFSFLSNAGGWQRWMFSAIAVVAAVWIVRLLRQHAKETLFCLDTSTALLRGSSLLRKARRKYEMLVLTDEEAIIPLIRFR